jgi:hypothetical protein
LPVNVRSFFSYGYTVLLVYDQLFPFQFALYFTHLQNGQKFPEVHVAGNAASEPVGWLSMGIFDVEIVPAGGLPQQGFNTGFAEKEFTIFPGYDLFGFNGYGA